MKSVRNKLTSANLPFEAVDRIGARRARTIACSGRSRHQRQSYAAKLVDRRVHRQYNCEARVGPSYGENLLNELANRLAALKVSNCNRRELYRYLRFYPLYPSIVGTLSPQLTKLLPAARRAVRKVGTASPQLRVFGSGALQ